MAKQLSLSDLERQVSTDPIFVLNTSANSDVAQAGEVLIGIPKIGGGKIDPLFIPQTWLPVEVTKQIPRAQLLASSEFRHAVSNNLITPIDEASASKITRQDGAKEERKRLEELRRHIREAGAARTISSSGATVTMVGTPGFDDDEEEGSKPEAEAKEPKSVISPNFAMFVDKVKTLNDIQALNEIRNRKRFSRKELEYLKANLADKPKSQGAVAKQIGKMGA